jgi:hypothetical protein
MVGMVGSGVDDGEQDTKATWLEKHLHIMFLYLYLSERKRLADGSSEL